MPQLSPLNWIFLFVLFWITVLTISILIWWSNKIFYQSSTVALGSMKENKWNW